VEIVRGMSGKYSGRIFGVVWEFSGWIIHGRMFGEFADSENV